MQPWAASGWTQTARLATKLPDGTPKEYFLKTCSKDPAEVMMKGEFQALEEMHSHMPESCPRPHSWGEYESSPGTYFLVTDFLDLIAELPDPARTASLVARLHEKTKGQSPNNMFGFHGPNCHGRIIQPNEWDPSWTSYFTKHLTMFFQADIDFNGPDDEYEHAFATTKQRVIPRLLDALTADGRKLTPCLVHGDLWDGNIATNKKTGESVVFDPSPFFAHHEYELGMWRRRAIPIDDVYREQYLLRNPPSEPRGEVDDRVRLYSLLFNISHCAHWEGGADLTRPE